jgi:hypothetical protein
MSGLILDADLERGLRDPGPAPTQADLDTLITAANAVVVRRVEYDERSARQDNVIHATDAAADLVSLREALRIEQEAEMGHCMCPGQVSFDFGRDHGKVGTVTLHHGESLRWDPFFLNAPLVRSDLILDWLSERGAPEVREEYETDRRRNAEWEAQQERWHAVMPAALEPLWPSILDIEFDAGHAAARLARAHPDPVERARILLEWFGQGEGPWNGNAAYEAVPERCLLEMPLDVLLEAARSEPHTESVREGAARLFAGWYFGKQRPRDLRRIPDDLKLTLLEHSLRSPDEDKRARALAAFGERE